MWRLSELARVVSTHNVDYALICENHGIVSLTRYEYERQLKEENMKWFCPLCGAWAEWDDRCLLMTRGMDGTQ